MLKDAHSGAEVDNGTESPMLMTNDINAGFPFLRISVPPVLKYRSPLRAVYSVCANGIARSPLEYDYPFL